MNQFPQHDSITWFCKYGGRYVFFQQSSQKAIILIIFLKYKLVKVYLIIISIFFFASLYFYFFYRTVRPKKCLKHYIFEFQFSNLLRSKPTGTYSPFGV